MSSGQASSSPYIAGHRSIEAGQLELVGIGAANLARLLARRPEGIFLSEFGDGADLGLLRVADGRPSSTAVSEASAALT